MIAKNLQEFYRFLQAAQPIIAVDYGMKKIGIAISNQEHTIAMPLRIIHEINITNQIKLILESIKTYCACAIVVGLPIDMKGQITNQTKIVLKFVAILSNVTDLPIYLQDERLTSKAANNLLKSLGMKRKERNLKDDLVAASMILETTLDSIKRL